MSERTTSYTQGIEADPDAIVLPARPDMEAEQFIGDDEEKFWSDSAIAFIRAGVPHSEVSIKADSLLRQRRRREAGMREFSRLKLQADIDTHNTMANLGVFRVTGEGIKKATAGLVADHLKAAAEKQKPLNP